MPAVDRRRSVLVAALGFAQLEPRAPELRLVTAGWTFGRASALIASAIVRGEVCKQIHSLPRFFLTVECRPRHTST